MKPFTLFVVLSVMTSFVYADMAAVHGMVLFGKKATYVSHLPMFHAPHDYQMIAQVQLNNTSPTDVVSEYQLKQNGEKIFTILPQAMDLSKLMEGEITSFIAQVYEGHFERGGSKIGPVQVTLTKIITKKKIAKNLGESNEFISFGQDGEYFLAHLIKGQKAYDALYLLGSPVTKTTMIPCGRAFCREPIQVPVADDELPVLIQPALENFNQVHPENVTLTNFFGYSVTVNSPFYVEYDELAD